MLSRAFAFAGLIVAGLTVGLSGPSPAKAEPAHYRLDPTHLTIAFLVRHIGYADTLGQFLKAEGAFIYDDQARTVENIVVEIDAKSVFSNHDARDNHVRSKDFLWAEDHPVIRFVGREAEPTGENTGIVRGDLTIRGVTQPVDLEVTLNKAGPYPWGDKHFALGISARTTIKRSDFGMTYAVEGGIVGDKVDIILEFEAIRQES